MVIILLSADCCWKYKYLSPGLGGSAGQVGAGQRERERQFCSSGAEDGQPDLSRLCLQEEVVTQTTKDRTHHGQEEGIYDP